MLQRLTTSTRAAFVCAALLAPVSARPATGQAGAPVSGAPRATDSAPVVQPTAAPPTEKPKHAAAVHELRVDTVVPSRAGLGGSVRVTILHLDSLVREGRISADSLVLFVNGRALADAHGKTWGSTGNVLEFPLAYSNASSDAWIHTFEEVRVPGTLGMGKEVRIGVGYPRGVEAPPARANAPAMLRLEPYTPLRFAMALLGVGVALAVFLWMAIRHDALRDPRTSADPREKPPFSLGRTQAAAWFFAVLASFVYIRVVTGSYNSLNEQALFFLGLAVATQAGASLVDRSRQDQATSRTDELAPRIAELDSLVSSMRSIPSGTGDLAARANLNATLALQNAELGVVRRQFAAAEASRAGSASEGFLLDILSDGQGVSLHRFQMAVWTVVFIGIYLAEVYQKFALPAFTLQMLGLMGLSSAAYVVLKTTERAPEPDPAATPTTPPTPPATDRPSSQREQAVHVMSMVGDPE